MNERSSWPATKLNKIALSPQLLFQMFFTFLKFSFTNFGHIYWERTMDYMQNTSTSTPVPHRNSIETADLCSHKVFRANIPIAANFLWHEQNVWSSFKPFAMGTEQSHIPCCFFPRTKTCRVSKLMVNLETYRAHSTHNTNTHTPPSLPNITWRTGQPQRSWTSKSRIITE